MLYDYEPTRGGWQKYSGNPVLGGPEMGTCFDVNVHRLSPGYRMYFSWRPKDSLACVESPDGLQWGPPHLLLGPRFESGWEERVNRNCVLYHDGFWHLWYTGQARGYSRLGHAISRDGLTFQRDSLLPVLVPEFPWERESVMNPFVLFDESRGVYRLWYAGGETYEPNAIGYAESRDAVHWEKSPLNPIFVPGAQSYDHARIGGCEIVADEAGGFLMFYIGYEDINTARICVAHSPDGITRWERLPANPILSPGEGQWDADACYKPSALFDREQNRWLLWYNGRHGNREYIGLAIHPGFALGWDA